MNQLISIVIPCYNDAEYIEQSVNSALNQTYPNIEVIVVDDGSNIETKIVLEKLKPKITKLITQDNKGQSTARNVGIKEAKGNYILTLDSDDFFETTFCEKAMAFFLEKRDVKLVTCQANLLLEDGSSAVFKPRGGSISNFLYSNDALGTSLYRKDNWVSCGGYDENMQKGFEDWEFFIRLLKRGGIAEVIQEPLYNYRKRSNSTTNLANTIKYELLLYIYIKHKELFIEDYENFVCHLLERIKLEEKDKLIYKKKSSNNIFNFLKKYFIFLKNDTNENLHY